MRVVLGLGAIGTRASYEALSSSGFRCPGKAQVRPRCRGSRQASERWPRGRSARFIPSEPPEHKHRRADRAHVRRDLRSGAASGHRLAEAKMAGRSRGESRPTMLPKAFPRLVLPGRRRLSAATLADPLVESASNAGLFGGAISPTTVPSTSCPPARPPRCSQSSTCSCGRARTSLRARCAWRACASVPLFSAIFAAQLVVLYAMETSEQIAVAGHALGGTVWLGAPVAVALALHALACALIVGALSRVCSTD